MFRKTMDNLCWVRIWKDLELFH